MRLDEPSSTMTPLRPILAAACLLAGACRSIPAEESASPVAPEPGAIAAPEEAPEPATAEAEPVRPGASPGYAVPEPAPRAPSSELHVAALKPDLVAERIVEHTALDQDAVIADLNSGSGTFTWSLARLVPRGRVLAVAPEPELLDALRAGLAERGLENIEPLLDSGDAAPFLPGGADVIFAADAYRRIEDRVAFFRGLRPSLRPGGHLVLLEYKEGALPLGPPADDKVAKSIRHAELDQAGYELVTGLATHIWHDFEFWRLRRAAN